MGLDTCLYAAYYKHWDCLQYAVDNKCPGWENTPRNTRSTSDEYKFHSRHKLEYILFIHEIFRRIRRRAGLP